MKKENQLEKLERVFKLQKNNYLSSTAPSYEMRIDRLNRLDKLMRNHMQEIMDTVQKDFGTRHEEWTFIGDIFPVLHHIIHVKKHLKKWIKTESHSNIFSSLIGQKSYLINEPLGVIGIVSPFNAPVSLAFDPAVEAFAAGNTAMIKISENTPHTGKLLEKLVAKYFKEEELSVVLGELEISKSFVSKPWDLFFFTGGSETAKKILESTAKNLTPSILELGGKSPCIVLDDADIKMTAEKIAQVRILNSGQVCISGDYAFVPENHLETFIDYAIDKVSKIHPEIINNKNYTSIINEREYNRIVSYIEEAKDAGCRIIYSNPKNENLPDAKSRKIPLTLIINPPKHLKAAQNEIFGPILTIFTYKNLDSVIREINSREKPLALYIFGKNRIDINKIVNNTSSGGVTINDLLMHANSPTMGFGGVGYSGMGSYKGGKVGFQAFTHQKAIYKQGLMGKFTTAFFPPYQKESSKKMVRSMVKVK